jgi:hypothetical protein
MCFKLQKDTIDTTRFIPERSFDAVFVAIYLFSIYGYRQYLQVIHLRWPTRLALYSILCAFLVLLETTPG